MPQKITIKEKTPPVWKTMGTASLITSIIFAILFSWADTTLWAGIFRLVAFTGLAVAILSYLQTRGKEREIELELSDEQLIVNYYLQSTKNQEEFFKVNTIDQIKRVQSPTVWGIIPAGACNKVMITFTDSPNTLSLFRIEGRDLMVSPEDAQKTEHFLDQKLSKQKK